LPEIDGTKIPRRRLGALLVAATTLATLGCGDAERGAHVGEVRSASVARKTLYVQADRLFNGRTLISGRVAAAVRGGKIVAAGRLRIPRGARVIRLRNATILPGFIDLHVHSSPPVLLRAGVTTTRNLGRPEAALRPPFALRGYPREVSAGPVITVPGGYPTGRHPGIAAPVRSVQEATAKVNGLVAKGAAVIKIALLAEIDGRPRPVLSVDQVRAIVAAAHRHRRLVTAHVVEGKGLDLALAGGIDELAHTPCVRVTRDQLAAVAARRIAVVGTLHGARVFFRAECPDLLSNARAFVEAGGRLLYGTDIPVVAATLDVEELGLMQQAGLTPTRVLRAATAEAGRQLGMAPLGTLVRGAPADLFVVRGDPTRSLRALRRPVFVMARGTRVR
jgi:imidazolonepropionase-like amidohydrolase